MHLNRAHGTQGVGFDQTSVCIDKVGAKSCIVKLGFGVCIPN